MGQRHVTGKGDRRKRAHHGMDHWVKKKTRYQAACEQKQHRRHSEPEGVPACTEKQKPWQHDQQRGGRERPETQIPNVVQQ
jgi:hypothetical protein